MRGYCKECGRTCQVVVKPHGASLRARCAECDSVAYEDARRTTFRQSDLRLDAEKMEDLRSTLRRSDRSREIENDQVRTLEGCGE